MNTRNDSIKTFGDDAASLAHTVSLSTEHAMRAAHDGVDAVREGAHQLREKSLHVRDATAPYIQHEPIKSVLIAAAVGAGLMGLLALFSRHRGNGH